MGIMKSSIVLCTLFLIAFTDGDLTGPQICDEIYRESVSASDAGIMGSSQKGQCSTQFGECLGIRYPNCWAKCVAPMRRYSAGVTEDWVEKFECYTSYIKCASGGYVIKY